MHDELSAQEKRIAARERLANSTKRMCGAAKEAGVRNQMFGVFQDEGYKGMYGGRGARDLKAYKRILPNEELFDRMGHTELAANEFRATQTEERLKRERIKQEDQAIKIHHSVGESVRSAIRTQNNTLPEDLPTEPSIKPLMDKRNRERRKVTKNQEVEIGSLRSKDSDEARIPD